MELKGGIIYTAFHPDCDVLDHLLNQLNKNYLVVWPTYSEKKKDEILTRFRQAEADFLVVHAKTGGTGLHVTHTNNMIYYALPESFIQFDQSKYRAMRLGQNEDHCNIFMLITKGSVEKQKMLMNLRHKGALNNEEYKIYRRKK